MSTSRLARPSPRRLPRPLAASADCQRADTAARALHAALRQSRCRSQGAGSVNDSQELERRRGEPPLTMPSLCRPKTGTSGRERTKEGTMRSLISDRRIVLAVDLFFIAAAASIATVAEARVISFVVEERILFDNGNPWGRAGPYERLKGTAYMEADPRNPVNTVIVNLSQATNARGRVEYASPSLILNPWDMTRGTQKIWYGMNTRGNCIEAAFRAFPAPPGSCNPTTA